MTELISSEERLRRAIAEGAFEEAREALREYSARLAVVIEGYGPDDRRVTRTLQQAEQLLDWAHRMTCAAREHGRASLSRLAGTRPYRHLRNPRTSTWRLEA